MLKYFTKGDILLVAVLFFLSAASVAGIRTLYNGGKHVVVEVDGTAMCWNFRLIKTLQKP